MSRKEAKEKTKARKIYDIVSTVIISLVFIFLVIVVSFMLWQRKAGEDSNIFGYYLYNVLTDSMEPTINTGDIIISKEIEDINTLKVGDVITFVAPSGRLKGHNETHRIVKIEYKEDGSIDYILTAGDNMYGGDSVKVDDWQLSPENVKAIYVKTSSFVTGIRDLLTKWYGYVVLIVLPLCIVFALFVVGIVQEKVQLEKEKEKQKYIENMSEEEKKKLAEEYLEKKEK